MDSSDAVLINGEIHHLRNDGTIHLGMTISYREVGTRRWIPTDVYGRAALVAGTRYETVQEAVPSHVRLSYLERLRNFVMRFI